MATNAERYRLIQRNQATIRQVNTILMDQADKVMQVADGYDQQQMGGFLREIIPGLIDEYGNINAVAAREYYDQQRLLALQTNPGRENARRAAERLAGAQLKSAIYVATTPKFDVEAKAEPIIGYAMSMFQQSGFDGMRNEMANALTRAVASYNRDTLLYNSALDRAVVGVQRVAEPNACRFCRTVAFGSRGSAYRPRVGSYAPHWHNNCHCSIETLYAGDKPFRPDYYDGFEYGKAEEALNAATQKQWDDLLASDPETWAQMKAKLSAQTYVSA